MTENRRVNFLLPNATMGQKILSSYASKLPGATALLPGTSSPGAMMLLLMVGVWTWAILAFHAGLLEILLVCLLGSYAVSVPQNFKMLEPVSDSKIPVSSSSCMQVFLFLKEFGASGKIFFLFTIVPWSRSQVKPINEVISNVEFERAMFQSLSSWIFLCLLENLPISHPETFFTLMAFRKSSDLSQISLPTSTRALGPTCSGERKSQLRGKHAPMNVHKCVFPQTFEYMYHRDYSVYK